MRSESSSKVLLSQRDSIAISPTGEHFATIHGGKPELLDHNLNPIPLKGAEGVFLYSTEVQFLAKGEILAFFGPETTIWNMQGDLLLRTGQTWNGQAGYNGDRHIEVRLQPAHCNGAYRRKGLPIEIFPNHP